MFWWHACVHCCTNIHFAEFSVWSVTFTSACIQICPHCWILVHPLLSCQLYNLHYSCIHLGVVIHRGDSILCYYELMEWQSWTAGNTICYGNVLQFCYNSILKAEIQLKALEPRCNHAMAQWLQAFHKFKLVINKSVDDERLCRNIWKSMFHFIPLSFLKHCFDTI